MTSGLGPERSSANCFISSSPICRSRCKLPQWNLVWSLVLPKGTRMPKIDAQIVRKILKQASKQCKIVNSENIFFLFQVQTLPLKGETLFNKWEGQKRLKIFLSHFAPSEIYSRRPIYEYQFSHHTSNQPLTFGKYNNAVCRQ